MVYAAHLPRSLDHDAQAHETLMKKIAFNFLYRSITDYNPVDPDITCLCIDILTFIKKWVFFQLALLYSLRPSMVLQVLTIRSLLLSLCLIKKYFERAFDLGRVDDSIPHHRPPHFPSRSASSQGSSRGSSIGRSTPKVAIGSPFCHWFSPLSIRS